nr:protein MCM10 homolog isoform X2 [Microcebus murinus]
MDDELRKLQEQMKSLQEQLKVATIKQAASPALPCNPPVDKSPRPPLKEKKVQTTQESACFSAELDVPVQPRTKRVARMPKASPTDPKSSSSRMTSAPSQPLQTIPGNKPSGVTRDKNAGTQESSGETSQTVSVEAFSGLRLSHEYRSRRPSPDASTSALTLDFPASRTVRKKFPFTINDPICVIF